MVFNTYVLFNMAYLLNDTLYINSNNNIGIGTTTSNATIDFSNQLDAIILPVGSTLERPAYDYVLRFNSEVNNIEFKLNDSWFNLGVVPQITSVSNLVLKNIDDTTTVTGTNFSPSAVWSFVDGYGNTYYPKQISNITTTSATLTRPNYFPASKGPYMIKVSQFGRYNTYKNVTAGVLPVVYQASGSLGSFTGNTAVSTIDISANDESGGGIVTMYISSGSLPSGLSGTFTQVGTGGKYSITGTVTTVTSTTVTPFTISTVDTGYNIINTNYSITVNPAIDVPLTISNLQLFLDANTYTSGTSWVDRSTNGYNFTINSTAFSNTGGIPHMNFEGSYGAAKRIVNSTLTDITAYANATIIVFSSILNSTTNPRTLIRGASADHQVLVQGGSNILGMYDNNVAGYILTTFDVSTLPNYTTKFNMLVFKLSTSSPYYQFKYNNTSTWYTLTNASATFNNGFCVVGAHHDGTANMGTANFSQYWGKIAMFMYYSRHLTDAEITSIYSFYQTKYSI